MNAVARSVSPGIVDHLAELTGHRDRDLLDITLAGAFKSLFQPRTTAIYRVVGEPGNERWTTRARFTQNAASATSDPAWIQLHELPKLSDFPARCDALTGRPVTVRSDGLCCSIFPIVTDRRVVGVLELETQIALDVNAHRMIEGMLHVYRNFETLLDYSERDLLTGLLNRKTFDEAFFKIAMDASEAASPPAGEPKQSYFVAMIDIDFFKSVNDRYGHLIGDEVLLLQAGLMRSAFRFQDRLFRFGGEEFVILMRCTDSRGALSAVERLRASTAAHTFPQVGRVTISIGLTEVRPGDSPSTALGRADKAVYFAKEHGRNQVQCYENLVAQRLIDAASEHVGEIDLF